MPADARRSAGTGAPGDSIVSLHQKPPGTSCVDPPCLPGAGFLSLSRLPCPLSVIPLRGCQPQVHGRSFPPHTQVEKIDDISYFGADLTCISAQPIYPCP